MDSKDLFDIFGLTSLRNDSFSEEILSNTFSSNLKCEEKDKEAHIQTEQSKSRDIILKDRCPINDYMTFSNIEPKKYMDTSKTAYTVNQKKVVSSPNTSKNGIITFDANRQPVSEEKKSEVLKNVDIKSLAHINCSSAKDNIQMDQRPLSKINNFSQYNNNSRFSSANGRVCELNNDEKICNGLNVRENKNDPPSCVKFQDRNMNAQDRLNDPLRANKVVSAYVPPEIDDEDKLYESFEKGENFEKLNNYKVEVSGKSVPNNPIFRFEDAKLTPRILENIKRLGYTTLTPVQRWSIPIILEGRDVMSSAQTGSGKTAAFLIPILSILLNDETLLRNAASQNVPSPMALIIAPTRELARQIQVEIVKFSRGTIIKSAAIYGGLDKFHIQKHIKGASIVVGTVGRLTEFVQGKKIDLSAVRLLVLDEADRMLDMGFHDEVVNLASLCRGMEGGHRQTLLFSATFPVEIQSLAYELLNDYVFVTVGMLGQANEDIKQIIWRVDSRKKKEKLIEVLEGIGSEKAIVFFQTKRNADALCITLGELLDKKITAIHGDLSQKEREEAIWFFREGKAEVLMATSVAARGLDIQGVKHVINYDLPKSIDEYVHRIGRTARCGNTGKALSFFSFPEDVELAGPLVRVLGETQQEVPRWLLEASSENPMRHDYSSRTMDVRKNGKLPARKMKNCSEGECNDRVGPLQSRVAEEEWM